MSPCPRLIKSLSSYATALNLRTQMNGHIIASGTNKKASSAIIEYLE